ncbi:MAG: hypothetical protein K2P88_03740 [Chitinophagaceae bacterium]|nr:hypothetical protein [Chitinophagaceae bacterium]
MNKLKILKIPIIAYLIVLAIFLFYELTGRVYFNSASQEKWSASGPGYHK